MVEFPKAEWADYCLVDSGNGLKLERFGRFCMIRPEPKALWTPSLSEREWQKKASVHFCPGAGFGKAGKEDSGTWDKLAQMPDSWYVSYPGEGFKLKMRLGLTAFKHVGLFPEQAPNWEFIYSKASKLIAVDNVNGGSENPQIVGTRKDNAPAINSLEKGQVENSLVGRKQEGRRQKVLNLFAYTGGASLAARAAGAEVTHLDSVRQVVSWARENMETTGLTDIRWVVEDAMKFARREAKRGHLYDGIILDPPAYGHGPDGEKWKLDELLFEMLRTVAQILNPKHGWMVLNLYSNGYSAALGETVVREAFGLAVNGSNNTTVIDKNDQKNRRSDFVMTSGELALTDSFGKALPLSIFVRLELGHQ